MLSPAIQQGHIRHDYTIEDNIAPPKKSIYSSINHGKMCERMKNKEVDQKESCLHKNWNLLQRSPSIKNIMHSDKGLPYACIFHRRGLWVTFMKHTLISLLCNDYFLNDKRTEKDLYFLISRHDACNWKKKFFRSQNSAKLVN